MTKAMKAVTRETEAEVFSLGEPRPIIVTIDKYGHTLGFRLKKHRKTFYLSTKDCYYMAVDAWATKERAKEKAAKKLNKRK